MLTIKTDNSIEIDGVPTGLRFTQKREGTVVFSAGPGGSDYREYPMPHARYSLAHHAPKPLHASPEIAAKYPPTAGRDQFEADIRALMDAA